MIRSAAHACDVFEFGRKRSYALWDWRTTGSGSCQRKKKKIQCIRNVTASESHQYHRLHLALPKMNRVWWLFFVKIIVEWFFSKRRDTWAVISCGSADPYYYFQNGTQDAVHPERCVGLYWLLLVKTSPGEAGALGDGDVVPQWRRSSTRCGTLQALQCYHQCMSH